MITPKTGIIWVFLFLALLSSSIQGESPSSMNGWQFHEYNIPKLEEAIQKAPEYDVNFFIFSHRLFRSVEGFLVSDENLNPNDRYPHLHNLYRASDNHTKPHPGWQRDLQHIGSLAEKQNIPYYLWIHEFDDIPEKFLVDDIVDFDHPGLFDYIRKCYNRLLDVLPGAAGFVLTFHESDYKIFRNTEVQSALEVPERIYQLTKLIYDVAKSRNKEFILRSFFYEPLEMQYFQQALSRLPDDVIVMNKTTFHEFNPFYPPNAMHGNVGDKRQIIEIDLGVEKAWSTQGAYAQLEYIQRYARRARDLGLTGMVGRARLYHDHPFENTHEINLYAFSRFMQNPELTGDQVAEDWARRRYPEAAVPCIASAYKRTQFINHHGRYHLGYWLTKSIGEQWDDYYYYFGHILLRSRYKWSEDPADKTLEQKIYYPDWDTYETLVAEKDSVLSAIRASIKDIEFAERYLTAEQYEPLAEDFRFLLDAGNLQKQWVRAFFAQRLYMQDPIEKYKIIVNDALGKLEKMDCRPGVTYGLDPVSGHRYNIDDFILEMRWRMNNKSRAKREDKQILERTRRKMQVRTN